MNKLERIARKIVAFKPIVHVNENGTEIPVDVEEKSWLSVFMRMVILDEK